MDKRTFDQLNKLNTSDDLIRKAKADTPPTEDCRITGWILADGTKLDYGDGDILHSIDHRRVCSYIEGDGKIQLEPDDCLRYFTKRTGALRYYLGKSKDNHSFDFDCTIPPTQEQWATIRQCITDYPGKVYYDIFDKNGGRIEIMEPIDTSTGVPALKRLFTKFCD